MNIIEKEMLYKIHIELKIIRFCMCVIMGVVTGETLSKFIMGLW